MGFWSDLFGEPKHFSPTPEYSNSSETGPDDVKLESPTQDELRERFDKLLVLLDSDRNNVSWPGWEVSAYTSSGRISIQKDSSRSLIVYKDLTIIGATNRVYQNFGLTTFEGFITKIESLIKDGTIKIEVNRQGMVTNALQDLDYKLMISKDSKQAFLWTGSTLYLYNTKHDNDLDLDYVESYSTRINSGYLWSSLNSNSWDEVYGVVSKLELDKFEYCEVSIEEHWMDEFAQGQLRDRILRDRDLDEWIQDIIRLHTRYNENAKQYEFAPAMELDSYEAIMIFLSLIKKSSPEFSYEEITNYLSFKGMLKEGYERRYDQSTDHNLTRMQSKFLQDYTTQNLIRNKFY